MIIEENNFKIESTDNIGRYDLYIKKVINKGKENEREEFVINGYDMPLENILRRLIHLNVCNKLETCDLKTFIKEYSSENKKLRELLDPINKDVKI